MFLLLSVFGAPIETFAWLSHTFSENLKGTSEGYVFTKVPPSYGNEVNPMDGNKDHHGSISKVSHTPCNNNANVLYQKHHSQ